MSRLTSAEPTFTTPAAAEHDRRKRRAVETEGTSTSTHSASTNERGEVRPGMGDNSGR